MFLTFEKLVPNYPTRVEQWLERWHLAGSHFVIDTEQIEDLPISLRRLRWTEELGQACYYTFSPVRVDIMVTIDGETMTQNQWIYREVTKVIPADRIVVLNRYFCEIGSIDSEYRIPTLPKVYRFLDNQTVPFSWYEMNAIKYHAHFWI